jgi:hypothetical protein
MRRAWDTEAPNVPKRVGADLWTEIEKTARRKAKRDAKRAAAGG